MLLLDDGPAVRRTPALPFFLAEPLRGVVSHVAFPFTAAMLTAAPRGDGHGVLVLPGLLGDDLSTRLIRGFLSRHGYDAHGWGLGRNVGPTSRVVNRLPRLVEEIADRNGGTVSVIGWSLGGIFAREIGRQQPDLIRDVITLASPYGMRETDRSRADAAFRRHSRRHVPTDTGDRDRMREPIPVPTTALYSRTDGIVDWRACTEPATADHENVAVRASHLGIGVDPAALWVIADRLSQTEGQWSPFRAPLALRPFYPQPV